MRPVRELVQEALGRPVAGGRLVLHHAPVEQQAVDGRLERWNRRRQDANRELQAPQDVGEHVDAGASLAQVAHDEEEARDGNARGRQTGRHEAADKHLFVQWTVQASNKREGQQGKDEIGGDGEACDKEKSVTISQEEEGKWPEMELTAVDIAVDHKVGRRDALGHWNRCPPARDGLAHDKMHRGADDEHADLGPDNGPQSALPRQAVLEAEQHQGDTDANNIDSPQPQSGIYVSSCQSGGQFWSWESWGLHELQVWERRDRTY